MKRVYNYQEKSITAVDRIKKSSYNVKGAGEKDFSKRAYNYRDGKG
jgi:hypothetical protein